MVPKPGTIDLAIGVTYLEVSFSATISMPEREAYVVDSVFFNKGSGFGVALKSIMAQVQVKILLIGSAVVAGLILVYYFSISSKSA